MPSTPHVVLPADPRYLAALRLAAAVAVDDLGCDDDLRTDLALAVDEIGGVLVGSARSGGAIEMSCHRDDDDLYVRLSVPLRDDGVDLTTRELTQHLLETTTASFDLSVDGDRLFGVLHEQL